MGGAEVGSAPEEEVVGKSVKEIGSIYFVVVDEWDVVSDFCDK